MLSRFVVSQVKHNSYFIGGMMLGLWITLAVVPLEDEAATVVACPAASEPAADDFEPHLEQRPLAPAGPAPARTVQRPRYYTTELGIRGSLMAGVLSSEDALGGRAGALNATAARLQPLRVFVSAGGSSPPRPNVVGFTDSREMLKPFNTLKYLADNYLDEYDFFFLVSDASFVNARRLQRLVAGLSVSQDVYMGTVADDDSHYCTLEGGILLSNSVLRAVQPELDWCVRNSYSAHHHENIGRCVLHAAHARCRDTLMGEQYVSLRLSEGSLPPGLADAVTAYPVLEPEKFYQLHAYVSRVYLERDAEEVSKLRAELARGLVRPGAGVRPGTGARAAWWPAGLRADPGLPPPPPDTRFDHLRWTWFNSSHALMPDDHRAAAPLAGAHADALRTVLREVQAWGERRWGGQVRLVEGAWRWEPPHALRYKLLLETPQRQVSAVAVSRVLGAARVVWAPYVTESARVCLLLPLTAAQLAGAAAALRRQHALLQQDHNTALTLVIFRDSSTNNSLVEELRQLASSLASKQRTGSSPAEIVELSAELLGASADQWSQQTAARRVAAAELSGRLPAHALVLILPADADYNHDFLNRARMNSIPGVQWFLAAAFARHAHYAHPRLAPAHAHSGHFRAHAALHAIAVASADLQQAMSSWQGGPSGSVEEMLWASPLRCLHAPEPGLLLPPPAPPCLHTPDVTASLCLRPALGSVLGDRHTLARLLLETQADTH